jgi:hypothetical protein
MLTSKAARGIELTSVGVLDERQVFWWMAQANKRPFSTAATKKR